MKIAVATKNSHKVKELERLIDIPGTQFLSLRDLGFEGEIEENGSTFEENALIKARAVCRKYGIPAISDDSGLCVDALGGAPGIYSARYASEDGENSDDKLNIKKLLANLSGVPKEKRGAHFVCAMALVTPDGSEYTVRGECGGYITEEVLGYDGFGYDPVFFSSALEKTFGQASEDEKNGVSHRYAASKKMSQLIEDTLFKKDNKND